MANLVEQSQWENGIYQLETLDPVEGGPNGIDNLQAKQLGNRTLFLKALIESAQNALAGHNAAADPHPQYLTLAEGNSLIATAVSALVNSSPATLDTLNELAAALGNDPNFATSMATALGNKQPIDQTLTALAELATAANKLIYATGPDAFSTTDLTAFARSLLDDADAAMMRATLGLGDVATKTVSGDFGSLQSSNGYQKLPSGLIIQWGTGNGQNGGKNTVYFPIAFPNACLQIATSHDNANDGFGYAVSTSAYSKTSFEARVVQVSTHNSSDATFRYIAVGQ